MKLKNIAVASALVATSFILASDNSHASVNVIVGGVNYTVDATPLQPYDTSVADPTYALTSQPWWGNVPLATQFATAVGVSLGNWNNASTQNTGDPGVLFVYALPTGSRATIVWLDDGVVQNAPGPTVTQNARYAYIVGYFANNVNLAPNAYALRSVYNIQSAALNAGLSYDCNIFDKQGFCLSTGGRYSTTNSPETNTTSGLLIGSYKYDKHIRLGAWVDQNLSTNNTTGMTLSNSNPLFGVFGAWAERNDGLGYEVKVSAGYGDKDVTVIRTSTNQGSTQLRMRGISTVSSFGFAIDGGLIAAPYVGVKYTSINRGAYTEGGSSALSYDNLRQESTTAVAGVRLSGKIDNQTGFVVSAGAEHDLNHNVGQYSAGSSNTTAFNSNVQKTRPVVTAGVFYDIDKTQRIGINAIHRQEPFQSTTSTTGLVTYTVGF